MELTKDYSFGDGSHEWMVCPNFQTAFREFMAMEWENGSYDHLGDYPCERVYEFPIYYACI